MDYEVEVIFNPDKIDLGYPYQNSKNKKEWILKDLLQEYIHSRLRTGLSFKKKESRVRILDEKIAKSG